MSVRPARPDEAEAISALAMRAKAHWGYDAEFLEACRPELTWSPEQIEQQDVLVWEEGGRLIGTTARGGAAPDGGLWAVFVDPQLHGRGIGRALVDAVVARARAAGCRTLTIAADPNAEGFYLAVGAVQIGEVPSDTRAGRILPLLRFDLAHDAVTELLAHVPGGALRIRVRGPEDGVPLLVLHGGPGLSDTYMDGLIDEFADDHRVATYAQRGVAPSTAAAPFDLAVQADDVIAVLDALGWADAVVLGHSWGGYLLLHVVAGHPGRVRAAIALDPIGAVGDGGAQEFEAELMSRLPAESVARLGTPDLPADEQLALIWPGYFPRGSVVPAPISGTTLHTDVLEAGWVAIAAVERLVDGLRGSAVPIVFVVPNGSPMPATASTDTAAVIGAAASVAMVDGGHFPWLTGPGAVRAAVDDLLGR